VWCARRHAGGGSALHACAGARAHACVILRID
jgi:hypothetical protein